MQAIAPTLPKNTGVQFRDSGTAAQQCTDTPQTDKVIRRFISTHHSKRKGR